MIRKRCSKCKKYYPATKEYFYAHKGRSHDLDNWCKECTRGQHRDAYFKKNYGITEKEFLEKLKSQDYKCTICGVHVDNELMQNFHVDHDHFTGDLRDILCVYCNTLLGYAKENPLILAKAIFYLKKFRIDTLSSLKKFISKKRECEDTPLPKNEFHNILDFIKEKIKQEDIM